ncbi:MAG TPA: ATP-binding protein [Lentisphaeria bacterium]|nr:MAG: hypothetical protein A2X45_07840 [Lentisphaerae bacterium GWF2_50_93]HCE44319.1 ATP-binding protein [Lentisphaeria bacterium]
MKNNPFTPNNPVYTGMFTGRNEEIKRINALLHQTKEGNPSNIMIIGERGIGKTSLLLFAKFLANGDITLDGKFNFISIFIPIKQDTKIIDLLDMINHQINRSFSHDEKALTFMKKTWDFISKFQIGGVSYKKENEGKDDSDEKMIHEGMYSIVDTIKAITEDNNATEIGLKEKKDGIVLFIDEVDNSSDNLKLGAFLKILSEILIFEKANKMLFIMSGLPKTRDVLKNSHESSLRLFEEFKLSTLSEDEVKIVINKGIAEANSKGANIKIAEDALKEMCQHSEGYPHFVQQIGYSVFESNTDDIIDKDDAIEGIFKQGGAIEKIGDRYYRDMYYNQIKEESYRQILNIMSDKSNDWISKKEIREKFKHKTSALNNGLKALKDRNIILSKPGCIGYYRLQWTGFAIWIKIFSKNAPST